MDLIYFLMKSTKLSGLLFQVNLQCIRYCKYQSKNTAPKTKKLKVLECKEPFVCEILSRCTIARSRMDIALLSHDQCLLLSCIEAKILDGNLENHDMKQAIKKLVCCSIMPLAFSRWGKLKYEKLDVVSLLVCPTCLLQLTYTKSDRPFGLNLRIEKTDDFKTMNYVLDKYVERYMQVYWNLESNKAAVNATIDPRDWSPVNFDFEDGVERKFRWWFTN